MPANNLTSITNSTALLGAVAVVTGAATGLGQGLALELATAGATVVVADINDCHATVAMINDRGGQALACECDVTDEQAVRRLIDTTLQTYGKINLLCANTGSSFGAGTLTKVCADDLRKTFELNVVATLTQVQAVLPALQAAVARGEQARILITGSEHSLAVPVTSPPLISYTSSKHALVGFAACARRDLEGSGIGVSLLCPGWIRTPTLMAHAARSEAFMQVMQNYGQEVAEVARLALAGLLQNDFVIPTNPASRSYSLAAHEEILAAISALPAEVI